MFEGKKGPRIYKRKKDAEFLAEMKNKDTNKKTKIVEIRVSESEKAKKNGATVHPDLSIASREPRKGERGWIVGQGSGEAKNKYGQSLEILSEIEIG